MEHLFPYKWNLKDSVFTKDKGKVFSCFAGGGGSSMGYKLAGFDVIGMNELDPKMAECYETNLNPKYLFVDDIRNFKNRTDFPNELFDLDILDGSPPCSSFSIAGNREKDWGKKKKFREGQKEQTLDDLFFDFIDLAEQLQPKIVLAENVKGLILGEAKKYVTEIGKAFDRAGYYIEKWLLDASRMGVPQRRERVFFIALRKDLAQKFDYKNDMFSQLPYLGLEFNEPGIKFGEFKSEKGDITKLTERQIRLLENKKETDTCFADITERLDNKISGFTDMIVKDLDICPTLTANGKTFRYSDNSWFSKSDYIYTHSFPIDYNFCQLNYVYVCGMSVPPLMIAQIATRIYNQWLSKINETSH